jgi:hypothetical protein
MPSLPIVLLLTLSLAGVACAQDAAPATGPMAAAQPIVPDAEIQAAIHAASGPITDLEKLPLLAKLAGQASDGVELDSATLARQLLYYLSQPENSERSPSALNITGELRMHRPIMARALWPYVSSPDPRTRSVALLLVKWSVGEVRRPFDGRPDMPILYGVMAEQYQRHVRELDPELAEDLYRVEPSAMLLTVATWFLWDEREKQGAVRRNDYAVTAFLQSRAAKDREEEARNLPRARQALDALARDGEWWIRMYAAEVLRRVPDLRTQHLMELMRKDELPQIRKLAREADDTTAATRPATQR